MGWNRGKKYKSIHLLEPFTSIPMIGTNIKKTKDNKKTIMENSKSFFWLIEEKIKMTINPSKIKNRCLKKKE